VYDSIRHHKTSNSLVVHVFRRVLYLLAIDMGPLSKIVLSLCPILNFSHEPSPECLINIVVKNEYGFSIFKCLSTPVVSKEERAKDALENYETSWPSQVSQAHILECLNEYRKGTLWTEPPICSVCGQGSREISELLIGKNVNAPFSLEILCVFIIQNCIVKCNSGEFMFGNSFLDGLMLDRSGVVESTLSQAQLNICPQCYTYLKWNKVPCLALANNLYRGILPDEFQDLTWVEEMMCAIYRNTAHITRLYGSSDPAQPIVLHGNTP
jgi:hypothetical protein